MKHPEKTDFLRKDAMKGMIESHHNQDPKLAGDMENQ
jgi:hypothetical protein